MNNIKNKIMVMSNKGGVGKSTFSFNLAYGLSQAGFQVGIMDADLHGPSLVVMAGLKGEKLPVQEHKIIPLKVNDNLKLISLSLMLQLEDQPVIWRGPLKARAIQQFVEDVLWGELDYLIVDAPPGTGDEPLSVLQYMKDIKGVVIVTTPQELALIDSRKAINFVRELKVPVLGVVENMSGFTCPHCQQSIDLFSRGGGKLAAEKMGVPFLGELPLDLKIVQSGDQGVSFLREETEVSLAFQSIMKKIISRLEVAE